MRIQHLVQIALFAALTAALGLIPRIDLGFVPVPITAQSLGPMLAGAILGARRGGLSQALFIGLIAAGLPLLSGGRGGLAIFQGPSAGFVIAFPIAAFVTGLIVEKLWSRLNFLTCLLATIIGGIGIIYLIGIPVLSAIAGLSLIKAAYGAGVFIPGDLIKAVLAASIAMFVKRGYPVISLQTTR